MVQPGGIDSLPLRDGTAARRVDIAWQSVERYEYPAVQQCLRKCMSVDVGKKSDLMVPLTTFGRCLSSGLVAICNA